MEALTLTVTAASVLFGFLFAGFWWALDREVKHKEEERHFKLSYVLLFLSMSAVAYFGILRPLKEAAASHTTLSAVYLGFVLTVVGTFGYMLTEFAHYNVFQRPKYYGKLEILFFVGTLVALAASAFWVIR